MRHQRYWEQSITNHHKPRFLPVAGVIRPCSSEKHGYWVLLRVLIKDKWQPLFYNILSVTPSAREDDVSSFGRPPRFGGGLFDPILPDENEYNLFNKVMRDLLSVFTERESRTVINEAVRGSLLESHQEVDAKLAGRTAQWYRDVTEAYDAELEYVEENIHSTLRRFTE